MEAFIHVCKSACMRMVRDYALGLDVLVLGGYACMHAEVCMHARMGTHACMHGYARMHAWVGTHARLGTHMNMRILACSRGQAKAQSEERSGPNYAL